MWCVAETYVGIGGGGVVVVGTMVVRVVVVGVVVEVVEGVEIMGMGSVKS